MTEKNPLALQETLQKFKKIFEAHTELKAKYEGLIAQHLLLEGDASMALPFATSALNRTENENKPFYHDYSENTLLIAQKKYSKALEQSLNLKTILQNQSSDNLLFALNLMRIGMLQQQLKLEKDELITWKEWESKMNEKNNKESFQKIVDIFSIGQISLTKYIETRIKLLS